MMTDLYNILPNASFIPDRTRPIDERQEQGDSPPGNLPGGAWHHVWSAIGWQKTTVWRCKPGSVEPDQDDPGNVPSVQPYMTDDGERLGIEVNDRRAVIIFTKPDVQLRANQRYLAKLTLTQDVVFARPNEVGENAVRDIRYSMSYHQGAYTWRMTDQRAAFGEKTEVILYQLLEAKSQTAVDLMLNIWIPFGNLEGKVILDKLELLEAPLDYGGDDPVLKLGDEPVNEKPASQMIPWGAIILIVAIVLSFLVIYSLIGQPHTVAAESATADLNSIIAQVMAVLLAAVTAVPGSGILVTSLVTIAKRLLPATVLGKPIFSGNNLNIAFHAVIWGAYTIALYTGHKGDFQNVLDLLGPAMTGVAAMIGGIVTSKALYAVGAESFWYKRS